MVDGLGRMPGDGSPARAWSGAASIMSAADTYTSVLPEPLADSAGATARLVLAHATQTLRGMPKAVHLLPQRKRACTSATGSGSPQPSLHGPSGCLLATWSRSS